MGQNEQNFYFALIRLRIEFVANILAQPLALMPFCQGQVASNVQ